MNLIPARKPQRPFGQHMRRAGLRAVVNIFLVSAPIVAASFLPMNMTMVAPESPEAPAASEPTKAERLIERYGCWTGEAPAEMQGVIPGHVVVSLPGEGPRLGGEALVGQALDNLFANGDHDITVHAFCR